MIPAKKISKTEHGRSTLVIILVLLLLAGLPVAAWLDMRSLSDNMQETFGLTPIEAMAAGLPSVVSDWDGYRDTVQHREHGFRIPTLAPPPALAPAQAPAPIAPMAAPQVPGCAPLAGQAGHYACATREAHAACERLRATGVAGIGQCHSPGGRLRP